MRIAVFSPGEEGGYCPGGPELYAGGLAEALRDAGHEVHVFAHQGQSQPRRETRGSLHIHRCPINNTGDFQADIDSVARTFSEHFAVAYAESGDFDIIHAHEWPTFRPAVRSAQFRNTPLVVTLHSIEELRNPGWESDPCGRIIREIEQDTCRRAGAVSAVSHNLAENVLANYLHDEKNCEPVTCGTFTPDYKGSPDAYPVKARLGLDHSAKIVLFPSPLEYRTGPDLLLEATPEILGRHPEARVVFAARGPMRAELEARANEIGCGWGVVFADNILRGELLRLIRASDVLVSPVRHEPLTPCIPAAWACGTPVVTGEGGAVEYTWHATTGLHVYNRADSVAWGVMQILDDPKFAEWLANNARVAADTAFAWPLAAGRFLRIYENIAACATQG